MGKAAELTTAEKKIILRLWKTNMSFRKIAEAVRGKSTIERVVKSSGTSVPPSKRDGSVKMDSRPRRPIIRKVSSGAGGAKKVRDALQLSVSVRTIQRCL
uniref:AlNc14C14G1603 protein n=1 Tax=Albugo laibachii Nc14 TaxID=890382 RepID=F0W3T8_9STRA|nr:AlNc14C14G1603 [Albugo laibachii Nc14]|eukprot:CCA15686.1 AlNc14C14G1603 [Albugo laibachii Nc14]